VLCQCRGSQYKAPRSLGKHTYHRFQWLLLESVRQHPERGAVPNGMMCCPARLDRVHAPIGLNIHARSPEEIAVSIRAEIIQVRRTSPVVISRRKAQHSYRQPAAPAGE
jgi:hypothetical protein